MDNMTKELLSIINELEAAVSKMGSKINKAGVIWNDSSFQGLRSNVGSLARETSALLAQGRECCAAVEGFERVAGEGEYV